jgi:arabinofuranan 3-O-arabinosyltransferase
VKRVQRALPTLALAAIAYVPLLLTSPGRVSADTKTYLYLEPAKLLSRAWSMWDPNIGLGTVTHQNLGYLFPLGPYYWVMETIGVPDWVAQRLWLGSILFAAGTGVRYLLGQLGWKGSGRTVAALAYMLSPYFLAYAARISVILLPWAALPWMIAMTVRSLRHGGWRDPARFALIVLVVGGVNATALVMVGLGPVLWLLYSRLTEPGVTWGRVAAATARIGVLTGLTSLWWVAGLWAQGGFGIPIVRYTETYKTVADASLSQEALRGLGYWFFYGRDKLGPWIEPGEAYTTNMWLLVASFAIPILALAAAATVRWRHRAFFLMLVALGGLIGVGAHPWDGSSPAGAAFRAFTGTDAGLALRSTPRALPLLVLAMAVFVGMGTSAVGSVCARWIPARSRLAATPLARPALARLVPSVAMGLLVVLNLPTLWLGRMVPDNLDRPQDVPPYWDEAAAAIDAGDRSTRVLEIPGADFASYRWGNTVDPITPGLVDRAYAARELIPYGSPASADFLNAVDRPLQEDTADPDALVTMARLMGVGDIVLRSDLQYERYRTPRPRPTFAWLNQIEALGPPTGFGEPVPNVAGPEQTLIDEVELGGGRDLDDPPPVAIFPVADSVPIVRAETDPPLILAGDATGLVAAAGAGLVEPGQPVRFAASLDPDEPVPERASIVITDTNRRAPARWGTIRENAGHTEQVGEEPLVDDPGDNRLEVFPEATDDDRTVAIHSGGASVQATRYGNPVTYTADDRAINAFDGDPYTAWRVGDFSDVVGERLVIDFDRAAGTRELTFLQPQNRIRTRHITELAVHHGDGETQVVTLDDTSLSPPGQTIELDHPIGDHLELEILDTNVGQLVEYDGQSGVGFAEVEIGDLVLEERIRPPTDVLASTGAGLADHDLAFLFSRRRSNPAEPVRFEAEQQLIRIVDLPRARTFDLDGTARVSGFAAEDTVAGLLDLDGPLVARSSDSLPGSLTSMAWAAFDDDPTTSWQTPFHDATGRWIEVEVPSAQRVETLELEILADGRHSVPTAVSVVVDDGSPQTVPLPEIADQAEPWSTTSVTVDLPEPATGSVVRVELAGVRPVLTTDWYGSTRIATPVGITELDVGQPENLVVDRSAPFDTGCSDQLVSIDDEPVPAQVTGTVGDALDRAPLDLVGCAPVDLASGTHVLRSASGRVGGLDADDVVLGSSAPRGDTVQRPPAPVVEITDEGRTSYDLDLTGIQGPFWLVLGQSHSLGWAASAAGLGDLGEPELIDGYANGWWIEPGDLDALTVQLRWWPQRVVNAMLVVSAIAALACLWLAVRRPPRPTGLASAAHSGPPGDLSFEPIAFGSETRSGSAADRGSWRSGMAAIPVPALILGGLLALLWVLVASPPTAHLAVSLVLLALAAAGGRWRWLAGASVAVIYSLVGVTVVIGQFLDDHRADFDWPAAFEHLHAWGVVVMVVCGGLGAMDTVRSARSARRAGDGEEDQGGVVDLVGELEVPAVE